eukprot:455030-Rhodomonas_salina.1
MGAVWSGTRARFLGQCIGATRGGGFCVVKIGVRFTALRSSRVFCFSLLGLSYCSPTAASVTS